VREAFRARDQIDIMVTSMGDLIDLDDLLRLFLEGDEEDRRDREGVSPSLQSLFDKGAIASVAYLPYSKEGPVPLEGADLRAVTLFEIPEMVQRAQLKNKYSVLIARKCGKCGRNRAEAVRPLLTVPALKVWTNLVMDVTTARGLLHESD
jgi:hypothetical protein